MKPKTIPQPISPKELQTIFTVAPELKELGALGGSTALLLEQGLQNPDGRWSLDIDIHNPAKNDQDLETTIKELRPLEKNKRLHRIDDIDPTITRYNINVGRNIRIEIAHPPLQHLVATKPSTIVPGLRVVQLLDCLMGKLDAASGRGFARDFYDLFLIQDQKNIHWVNVFERATKTPAHTYSPEALQNNIDLTREHLKDPAHWESVPVATPRPEPFMMFLDELSLTNKLVASGAIVKNSTLDASLAKAIQARDLPKIAELTEKGANPLRTTKNGECGLQLASKFLDQTQTSNDRKLLSTVLNHCPGDPTKVLQAALEVCTGQTSRRALSEWVTTRLCGAPQREAQRETPRTR